MLFHGDDSVREKLLKTTQNVFSNIKQGICVNEA